MAYNEDVNTLTPTATYSSFDNQRFTPENRKSTARTNFERDRARIMYSSAFRRLGAKTQVLGPISNDFIRTRLTHSMEVSQVGRVLAKSLGCDPDVVDAACLAHDLGHPPYGHDGEKVLDDIAADIGGFEGNAQTFRLLVRLEPKIVGKGGQPCGVNLTRATLDGVAKYPWGKGQGPNREKSVKKYSVYDDDRQVFDWMRQGAPDGRRCLEAQLMDISDDIAYSVHDVEDCIHQRYAHPNVLRDSEQRQLIWTMAQQWYGPAADSDRLDDAADRLLDMGLWIDDYDGTYTSMAALKDMTSQLIGRFCEGVHNATRAENGDGPLHRYDCDLVIPDDIAAEILVLKAIAAEYVMEPKKSRPEANEQRAILFGLADIFMEQHGEGLDEPFKTAYQHADGEAGRLRAVIDNIASMTDVSARARHSSLVGMPVT